MLEILNHPDSLSSVTSFLGSGHQVVMELQTRICEPLNEQRRSTREVL